MYAIRSRSDPSIFFHYPESGGRKQMSQIDSFKPGRLPRLFTRKQHALSTLNTWTAGKLISGYTEEGVFSHQKLVRVPGRKKEDWEIVEVAIVPKADLFPLIQLETSLR